MILEVQNPHRRTAIADKPRKEHGPRRSAAFNRTRTGAAAPLLRQIVDLDTTLDLYIHPHDDFPAALPL